MVYDLSHLTQVSQNIFGPIQDDEGLLLFGLIRSMKLSTILELGGLWGYSAKNFLQAVGPTGVVFTVDTQVVDKMGENHICLHKNARDIDLTDFENYSQHLPVELVFFDCHDYDASITLYDKLLSLGVINNNTILALHDTGLHPEGVPICGTYEIEGGWVHQRCERQLVNLFVERGYHAFNAHMLPSKATPDLQYRHGLTIMQLHSPLVV